MNIGLAPRLTLALRCVVCERNRDGDHVADSLTSAALFGAKPYAICPGCSMEVLSLDLLYDPGYRRRARVRFFEKTGRCWPTEECDRVAQPRRKWNW